MDRAAFHYDLPAELIAQTPLPQRSASRLLALDGKTGAIADRHFIDLVDWLEPADLLVLNDTRVLPARLTGHKVSGGRIELLLERLLGERSGRFQIRASRSPKVGAQIVLDGNVRAQVSGRHGDLFDLSFDCELLSHLEEYGAIPLPPYIDRIPDAADSTRYQTVFATQPGAVAAPTAGLHFDVAMLDAISAHSVEHGWLTLHVGAGTFSPVRTEKIEDHHLHAERVEVSAVLCDQIARARERGGRIIAVGTTTVRALETAGLGGLAPFSGETDLFITPGFRFRLVDAIVTNFHLPESTLLMLVAAYAGHDNVMRAYHHAMAERYRFFSYGDAMLLTSAASA